MRERFVCHKDDCASNNIFHKNSTIVELPDGDLMAAWFAGDVGEGNRDQDIYGSRLPTDGDEWTDSKPLVRVGGRAVGCPVLFVGPGEELWLTAPEMYGNWIVSSRLLYKRSPDFGETWYDLEILHPRPGLYLKNKPLYLPAEERWLLGADILHSAEDRPGFLVIPGDHHERLGDFPNLVGGDQIVPRNPEGYMRNEGMIYPTATELSDGTLLAYMRPRPGGYLWETRSHDRGINWTGAEETDIPNPDAGFDLHRTRDGNLVLVINPVSDTIPEGRNHLAILMSEDDGETWPHQLTLEHETIDRPLGEQDGIGRPEFTYGNIIQTTDGTLHFTYEYRRSGIKHVELTEDEIRREGTDEIVPEIVDP